MQTIDNEVLLTVETEGGIVRRYNTIQKRWQYVNKTITRNWRINVSAVNYFTSFNSRPDRIESYQFWSKWLKLSPRQRLKYHLKILSDSVNGIDFTFEII